MKQQLPLSYPLPFMKKAREAIFSQEGLLMAIRRTAWWLFEYQMRRQDPATGKNYTPGKALDSVLRWMDEQSEMLERVKQEPTQLQRRLLQMLVDGKPQKQIAHELQVSRKTLHFHLYRLRNKLGKNLTLYQVIAISVKKNWIKVRQAENFAKKEHG